MKILDRFSLNFEISIFFQWYKIQKYCNFFCIFSQSKPTNIYSSKRMPRHAVLARLLEFYALKNSIRNENPKYFFCKFPNIAEICSFLLKYATAYAICTNLRNMQKYAFIRRHFCDTTASLNVVLCLSDQKNVWKKNAFTYKSAV